MALRIHCRTEDPATVLDPTRPDGWVASDEDYDTQPHGVSCCASLRDLLAYANRYSMGCDDGDLLLVMSGSPSHDDDRDEYAMRLVVDSYEVACRVTWEGFRALYTLYRDDEDALETLMRDPSTWDDDDREEVEYLDDAAVELASELRAAGVAL